MAGVPKEYADQYWSDMDRELAEWIDYDPVQEEIFEEPVE